MMDRAGEDVMQHVLVVDQPAICSVVQMGLETDGSCRVSAASTTEDALCVMLGDRPDAAIIDTVSAAGQGFALASQAVDFGIPVLLMTGEPYTQARLSEVGCPYLAKPFHLHTLVERTRALLDDSRQYRAELSLLLRPMIAASAALRTTLDLAREALVRVERDRLARSLRRGG
jgi:DNA-binding response OmpR family regulator